MQEGGKPLPGQLHDHERRIEAERIYGIGQGRGMPAQRLEGLPQPLEVNRIVGRGDCRSPVCMGKPGSPKTV